MAEVRKRNVGSKTPSKSTPAKVQAPPASSSGAAYLLIPLLAGLTAYLGYSYASSGAEVPIPSSAADASSAASTLMTKASSAISSAVSAATESFSQAPEVSTDPEISTDDKLKLTDAELLAFTGEDPEKPIYVALNGTIFDVSSGRGFYGPGGHYGHFAGRDATRAWVSECFDKEYLTWDMKGVEKMFLPKWMDEEMEEAAAGLSKEPMINALGDQAKAMVDKFGKVSKKEKKKRREEDAEEVKKSIDQAMGHWMNFFKGNPKYKEVGVVVGREELPEDREDIGLCEEALKKRPVKGGKFEALMQQSANLAGQAKKPDGKKADGGAKIKGGKPDWVKG